MSSKNETAPISNNNQPLSEKKRESSANNAINITNNSNTKENLNNAKEPTSSAMNAPRDITISTSSNVESDEQDSKNSMLSKSHHLGLYKSKYDKFDSLVPPLNRESNSSSGSRKINNNPLIYPSFGNSTHSYRSSISAALQRFYKTSIINLELKTLVIQYIAKTGDLPVLSEEEVNNIPKLKFGQHLYKTDRSERYGGTRSRDPHTTNSLTRESNSSGFQEPTHLNTCNSSGGHPNLSNTSSIESNLNEPTIENGNNKENILNVENNNNSMNLVTSGSSGRSSKLSMVSSDSEIDDSEDEMTVYAWKENYMKQYGMDVTENDNRFKVATNKVNHARKIWKIVQSVIEKKMLTQIDEYNKLYDYEKAERRRCESKNCEYISFTNFKKMIHKRFTSYFDDMPPFTIQRVCELLVMQPASLKNCAKFMRALDKNLQVTSYWQPFGYTNLFEEKDEDNLEVDVDMENEDEDRGSMFNDTASMHSMHSNSKHSWHSRSMQSPRSVGSQSPYQGTILEKDDPEMYSIMDVGPGHSSDMINRVPSPIGLVIHKAEQAEIDAANEKEEKNNSLKMEKNKETAKESEINGEDGEPVNKKMKIKFGGDKKIPQDSDDIIKEEDSPMELIKDDEMISES